MSDTVNGWRGSLASRRCSYDWALNAANTKNQVGTEVADQVVYVNTAVDADNQPLDGTHAYVLRFESGQTPPVAGMWNIAMYDEATDCSLTTTLVASPSAAPPTELPNCHTPTGSLTIYLQSDKPTDEQLDQ